MTAEGSSCGCGARGGGVHVSRAVLGPSAQARQAEPPAPPGGSPAAAGGRCWRLLQQLACVRGGRGRGWWCAVVAWPSPHLAGGQLRQQGLCARLPLLRAVHRLAQLLEEVGIAVPLLLRRGCACAVRGLGGGCVGCAAAAQHGGARQRGQPIRRRAQLQLQVPAAAAGGGGAGAGRQGAGRGWATLPQPGGGGGQQAGRRGAPGAAATWARYPAARARHGGLHCTNVADGGHQRLPVTITLSVGTPLRGAEPRRGAQAVFRA